MGNALDIRAVSDEERGLPIKRGRIDEVLIAAGLGLRSQHS